MSDLREAASRYRAAEWALRIHEDEDRLNPAHNARVEEWRAADAALAALLGELSPFTWCLGCGRVLYSNLWLSCPTCGGSLAEARG